MKKITSLLALATAAIGLQSASAALLTYTTSLDNSFDNTLSAPFVGSASFSYNKASALADGFYTFSYLNSFSPVLSISFNNGNSFSLSDLVSDPSQTGVYLSGSSFILAGISGYTGPKGGTADFIVGGTGPVFSSEAIWINYSGSKFFSNFRDGAIDYPLYMEASTVIDYDANNTNYMGSYGFDVSLVNGPASGGGGGGGGTAAVPEPGQVAASLLLLSGIGGYVFLKRRKPAKPALVPTAA
jgi:hypothetical protein